MGTSEIRFTIITADGVSVSNEYKHVPGGILVSEMGSYKTIPYEDIVILIDDLRQYKVSFIAAYNGNFDYRALKFTAEYLNNRQNTEYIKRLNDIKIVKYNIYNINFDSCFYFIYFCCSEIFRKFIFNTWIW